MNYVIQSSVELSNPEFNFIGKSRINGFFLYEVLNYKDLDIRYNGGIEFDILNPEHTELSVTPSGYLKSINIYNPYNYKTKIN